MTWPRWDGTSRIVHAAVAVAVIVLAYGTVVHVWDLVGSGGDSYRGFPGALRVYWVTLTVLDPLAAVLLVLRRRSGVVLAVVVLISDAAANGYANYSLDPSPGVTAGRVGHAVVTVLAVAMIAVSPAIWRSCRSEPRSG